MLGLWFLYTDFDIHCIYKKPISPDNKSDTVKYKNLAKNFMRKPVSKYMYIVSAALNVKET